MAKLTPQDVSFCIELIHKILWDEGKFQKGVELLYMRIKTLPLYHIQYLY